MYLQAPGVGDRFAMQYLAPGVQTRCPATLLFALVLKLSAIFMCWMDLHMIHMWIKHVAFVL